MRAEDIALIVRRAAGLALLLAIPRIAATQDSAALANDPRLFLATEQQTLKWNEPAEPVRLFGPLYFVGTKGLAAWLITTPVGHILLNTGMPGSGPQIAASIRKFGLRPKDIRLLLAGSARIDHVGAHAYMQSLSGARVAMIAEEADLIESGGKLDFQYGAYPEFRFDPVHVDQVFHDGDTLSLGNVSIVAHLTPGYTKGSTTFVAKLGDRAGTYTVVFSSGTAIDPGYRLVNNPSYPGIADDYRRTFQVLAGLEPDMWLDANTEVFDFEGRLARVPRDGMAAWLDRLGYHRWVSRMRAKFEATVSAQSGKD